MSKKVREKSRECQVLFTVKNKKMPIVFIEWSRQQKVCCGTHYEHIAEMLLMSTHNIYFPGEIRKEIFPVTPSYLELCVVNVRSTSA